MMKVAADEAWYSARRETERSWEGVLVERAPVAGPRARTALTHALRADGGETPIYAASIGERLAPLVNRRVRILAKLVDLSSEGFGEELWIGWIATVSGPP
jgi:hypothetical protein